MSEPKVKEGELTDADLAAYGIPPKMPDGPGVEIEEQAVKVSDNPDGKASGDVAEKGSKV